VLMYRGKERRCADVHEWRAPPCHVRFSQGY
jgi:hypothetical protein